ncbi:helix-turn-helix transcriptional regulator [Flavobacterium zhairuonense]|uniref:helix-turn-helix domain-containing protein n=1 Tax=Flavobacterium zhairuonense TaxID=2493631 RepID=UPI001049C60F|nr:helix-turn-helix transcriptional regulator [Flavobacterium zhairuonense]KAF2511517.1 helix-turn-helix transcriptional regulator [Flavobacterium zhairuonense]
MMKRKLINKRIEKNKTQEEVAYLLGITQSQYSRRESGITKITKNEWDELAKILDTNLQTIYESHDGIFIANDQSKKNLENLNHEYFEHFEFSLLIMKKYIEKLEQENKSLKMQINNLMSE